MSKLPEGLERNSEGNRGCDSGRLGRPKMGQHCTRQLDVGVGCCCDKAASSDEVSVFSAILV